MSKYLNLHDRRYLRIELTKSYDNKPKNKKKLLSKYLNLNDRGYLQIELTKSYDNIHNTGEIFYTK